MAEKGDGMFAKIFVGVITAVLTTVIVTKMGLKDKADTPPKVDTGQAVNPSDISKVADKPKLPDATRTATPVEASTVSNTSMPSAAATPGMLRMEYPNTWYGPFGGGDYIQFSSAGGFFVYSAQMINTAGTQGALLPYYDPTWQWPRNVWVPLQQSRFYVFVDSYGNVFVWAQP